MMRFIFQILIFIFFITFINESYSQQSRENSLFKIGRVKYSGGGDWYNDPSSEVNLLNYIKQNTNIPVEPIYTFVDLATDNIYSFPFLFMTGHGNMNLSNREVTNLRTYLENGGFLYIDDDYGFHEFVIREMRKVFPEQKFVEIPYSHGIFNCHYKFPNGTPKVHSHDDKPPQSYGLFIDGRLCVFYTYESNPSDGWADPEVHKNPPELREKALQFGVNVVVWALLN